MNSKTMNDITLPQLRDLITNTRRLVVFAASRGHAKVVERLCCEARRSVVSHNWGIPFSRCLRIWDVASQCDAGLVLVIRANAGTVSGWRTVGDGAVWVGGGKPLDPNEIEQARYRVMAVEKKPTDPPVFAPFHFCRVSVAALETQPVVA